MLRYRKQGIADLKVCPTNISFSPSPFPSPARGRECGEGNPQRGFDRETDDYLIPYREESVFPRVLNVYSKNNVVIDLHVISDRIPNIGGEIHRTTN